MSANDKQIGGDHYAKDGEQHWDRMFRLYGRGYFVGCATKYIERYHKKNGKQDLEKAIHFLEKLIELEYPAHEPGIINDKSVVSAQEEFTRCTRAFLDSYEPRSHGYVNQDGLLNSEKAFDNALETVLGPQSNIK